jgi:hypothetical protein
MFASGGESARRNEATPEQNTHDRLGNYLPYLSGGWVRMGDRRKDVESPVNQ